jgi:hypothetical protein
MPPMSPGARFKLLLKRRLSPTRKTQLKRLFNNLMLYQSRWLRYYDKPQASPAIIGITSLCPGDWVRIRSRAEIEATLNFTHALKGCAFMGEMWEYCGTTHRVLKCVQRFVDERDYQVKKARGIVLLEGVMCQGTELYGRCDRACFFFWREEWLEKIQG